GVGTVVYVEQAALGRLEEDSLSRPEGVVQQANRVGDVRAYPLGVFAVLAAEHIDVEGKRLGGGRGRSPEGNVDHLCDGSQGAEQTVLARDDVADALAQVGGVEQFADADTTGPADLVHVTGTDATAGRAD